MDQNQRDTGGEVARREGETGGRVSPDTPPHGYATQQTSEVPPELRPTDAPYGGEGEPTRQFGPPPPSSQGSAAPSSAYQGAAGTTVVERRQQGTPIVGPVLLIGAGLLFLLDNLNVIDFNIGDLFQLWPLLLIAIGLDLILGRRNPVLSLIVVLLVIAGGLAVLYSTGGLRPLGNVMRSDLSVPLGGARSAEITIRSGVSRLNLDSDGGSQLAGGTLEYYESWGAPRQDVNRSGDTVSLEVAQGQDRSVSIGSRGPEWDINLNGEVPLKLTVEAGVGETNLDLENAQLTDLDLNLGVGSTTVTFPEQAGTTRASIEGGVGSLKIFVPEDVGARITVNTGLGGVDADDRFNKEGDVYTTEGYATAENKLDVTLDVGVGGVEIRSR